MWAYLKTCTEREVRSRLNKLNGIYYGKGCGAWLPEYPGVDHRPCGAFPLIAARPPSISFHPSTSNQPTMPRAVRGKLHFLFWTDKIDQH